MYQSSLNNTDCKQETIKGDNFVSFLRKDCHDITEIYPNIFLGEEDRWEKGLKKLNIDIAVPLSRMDGDVWDSGWRGDIFYVPITDYGVLPEEILIDKATELIGYVASGKSVAIFCMGGHGRTGYFTSAVLWLLGVHDPVQLIRDNYCKKAVESMKQIRQLEWLTGVYGHKPVKVVYNKSSIWSELLSEKEDQDLLGDLPCTDETAELICNGISCEKCNFYGYCYGESYHDYINGEEVKNNNDD